MTGGEYADLVASYLAGRFATRGLKVYREVSVGKTIIGKNRRVDVFCVSEDTRDAFAVECKFQDSAGTVDEKIPYALDDMNALPMAGCIAYAGKGLSEGVLHMLRGASRAAYCLPAPGQCEQSEETWELDHQLAIHFRWWDVLIGGKRSLQHPRLI